jgi:phosphate-selective porin OprO/OprP
VLLFGAARAGEPAGSDLEERVRELERRLGQPQVPGSPAAAATGDSRVYWKDSLRFETADKQFKVKIGGRVFLDFAVIDADDDVETVAGDQEDGVEFRTARIDISGAVYGNIEWRTEFDFSDGDADFKNVYMGMTGLPVVGNVRVGIFEQPITLDKMCSGKYTTFMEKSLARELVPSETTGIMLHDRALDGRLSWAAGAFRCTDSAGDYSGDGYHVTARLTGLPYYREKGRKLIHVGVDFSHSDPGDDALSYDARPESHLTANLVDTGDLFVNSADAVVFETAAVWGPVSLQAEYVHSFVSELRDADDDPEFRGLYVQASYFLTGECRPYSKKDASFGRVRPLRNFSLQDDGVSPGAWEVALRYSHLDLDDGGVNGGELDDVTVGLNWYLNPVTRIMWNYVHSELEDVGDVGVFQMRFQVAF